MRKCKFITGTLSLTLAAAVGFTSVAQFDVNANTKGETFVYEITNVTEEPEVETSANEKNVLTASEVIEAVSTVTPELETPGIITVDALNQTEVQDNKTESESKEQQEQTETKKSKKKSKKKKSNKKSKKKSKKTTKKKSSKKKSKKNSKKKKSKKSSKHKLEYMGNYKITAYCSCSKCCGKSTGITASGTKAKAGRTIAADTSVLPFGTQVVIDGHTYTVEDRGGAINGHKIDVYFSSHSEALSYGVKYTDVYVQK